MGVLCKPLNLACTLGLVMGPPSRTEKQANSKPISFCHLLKITFHFILSVCNEAEEVCNVREEGISNNSTGTFNTDMQYCVF